MAWTRRTYLQLVVKWKVEIDMMNYPSNCIILPRLADKDHASQVVKGWKIGMIKWVELSDSDVDACRGELAKIMNDAASGRRRMVEGDGQEGNLSS